MDAAEDEENQTKVRAVNVDENIGDLGMGTKVFQRPELKERKFQNGRKHYLDMHILSYQSFCEIKKKMPSLWKKANPVGSQ